jgi:hypothetical protein
MELQGKIVAVLPEQRGNGSKGEWVKNAFVIEWMENGFKQHLCLEVMGEDKFEKMKKAVVVGYDVQVRFNVTSREYQGRFYTSASCFYCANIGAVNNQSQQAQQQQRTPSPAPQTQIPQDGSHVDNDQLPF